MGQLPIVHYDNCSVVITIRSNNPMTYVLSVIMLKSLILSLTISVTLILFICFFTKETYDEKFKGYWAVL